MFLTGRVPRKQLGNTLRFIDRFTRANLGCCNRDKRCDGKYYDPICNIRAAINLFLSTCNDGGVAKDNLGKAYPIPHNPLNGVREAWGCTRSEGPKFKQCITLQGITQQMVKALPCPSKGKNCGCKPSMAQTKDRGYIDGNWDWPIPPNADVRTY